MEKKQLRSFGFLMTAAFAVLALSYFRKGQLDRSYLFMLISLLFGFVGLISPKILKPLLTLWLLVGHVLGKVNSTLLLTVFFSIILTPVAVILRVFNVDLLGKKISFETKSYWVKREQQPTSLKRLY